MDRRSFTDCTFETSNNLLNKYPYPKLRSTESPLNDRLTRLVCALAFSEKTVNCHIRTSGYYTNPSTWNVPILNKTIPEYYNRPQKQQGLSHQSTNINIHIQLQIRWLDGDSTVRRNGGEIMKDHHHNYCLSVLLHCWEYIS